MRTKNLNIRQKKRLAVISSNGASNNNFRQPKFINFFINNTSGLSEQYTMQLKACKSKSIIGNVIDDIKKRLLHTSNHGNSNENNNSRQSRPINFVSSNLQAQLR